MVRAKRPSRRIATFDQRGVHVLTQLAMERVLCFGPHRGKQPTFVLLDEWIPTSRELSRDEALGELAGRYFTSHGPASMRDFAWWSGLTLADARRGVALAEARLSTLEIDGERYWHAPNRVPDANAEGVHLLPPWDEYTVAYRDRSAFLDPRDAERAGNGIFSPTVLIDGRVAGTWRRVLRKDRVVVTAELFTKIGRAPTRGLERAAARYGEFLGLEASLELRTK